MRDRATPTACTLGEAMIYQIASTIEDGIVAFHGFGSPLVQLALHLAKKTHAPDLVLVAGATYGVNPTPPFLAPTTNDWVMNRGRNATSTSKSCLTLRRAGAWAECFSPVYRSTAGAT